MIGVEVMARSAPFRPLRWRKKRSRRRSRFALESVGVAQRLETSDDAPTDAPDLHHAAADIGCRISK
jgi:hypothetical protein